MLHSLFGLYGQSWAHFCLPNLLLSLAFTFFQESNFLIYLITQTRNWGSSPDTSSSPIPTSLLGELFWGGSPQVLPLVPILRVRCWWTTTLRRDTRSHVTTKVQYQLYHQWSGLMNSPWTTPNRGHASLFLLDFTYPFSEGWSSWGIHTLPGCAPVWWGEGILPLSMLHGRST